MSTVTMSYGTYNFNPVPSLGLARDYKKTEDGRILYCTTKITLDGILTPYPTGAGGISTIISYKDALKTAFDTQGCAFVVKCDTTTLLSGNPNIDGLSFKDTNNWVNSVGYTIGLEMVDLSPTGEITSATFVDSITDDWTIEPLEDKPYYSWTLTTGKDEHPYLYKLNHNLGAKGRAIYSGCSALSGSKEPWEYARDFCSGQAGYPTSNTAFFSLPNSNLTPFNHHRTQSCNKKAGQYSITENWMVFASGTGIPGNAVEDFSIDIQQPSETDIVTVGIQGTIQGLESATYTGFDVINKSVTQSKYTSALAYWSGVQGRLLPRAQQALTNGLITQPTRTTLNPSRINKTVGQNLTNGVISYNYGYTNKVSPCVANALFENIQFSYEFPQDVFAEVQVLGRTSGPIIQLMGTRTPYTCTVNIDVVVPIVTGCGWDNWKLSGAGSPHAAVKSLLVAVETGLTNANDTIVKIKDTPNWIPTEGKYTRNVSWKYNTCAGAGTTVSALE